MKQENQNEKNPNSAYFLKERRITVGCRGSFALKLVLWGTASVHIDCVPGVMVVVALE